MPLQLDRLATVAVVEEGGQWGRRRKSQLTGGGKAGGERYLELEVVDRVVRAARDLERRRTPPAGVALQPPRRRELGLGAVPRGRLLAVLEAHHLHLLSLEEDRLEATAKREGWWGDARANKKKRVGLGTERAAARFFVVPP